MGSKRSSSKASKAPSIPPPPAPPAAESFQSSRSHNPESPFKSQKKPKLSTPKSPDSGFLPPVLPPQGKNKKLSAPKSADSGFLSTIPSTDGEAPSQNIDRKSKAPDISNEISPTDGRASRSTSVHWGKTYNLKFLESLLAFRLKHGILPTRSKMVDFLTEISDWAPRSLSEKNMLNKIRHFRFMFQKNSELRPESSEYERACHQLGLQLWGAESLKTKGSAAGTLHDDALKEDVTAERKGDRKGHKQKAASKKLNVEKQNADDAKEYEDDEDEEEEEGDDESDEDGDEKAVQTMEIESVKEHEKDDLLVGEDNGLLDGDVTKFSYKYLKLALEEYWKEAKLNMNTLYSALQKVDPVQAKLLDEQYSEIFKGMLKLKMEKNELFNKIIRSSLGH